MKYLFVFLCFAFSAKLLAEPCQDAATGRLETSAQKKFLPFLEARAKARSAGISSSTQYIEWQKNHPDMPSNPNRSYPDQWTSWGDFLGTGRIYKRKEDILPFLEASEKVRLAGISTKAQYRTWHKDHPDMPSNPPQFYKEWKGWGDFLGTGRFKSKKEDILPFLEAREKARSAGISSSTQYIEWQKNHPDMPPNPPQFYKGQWPGWGDFLGTGRIYKRKEDILPFLEASEKVRLAGISTKAQYRTWHKDHPDMPSHPDRSYPDQWTSWGDFLGTGRIYKRREDILPFLEARKKARLAGILSEGQYKKWHRDHLDMPSNPPQFYKGQWKGWGKFLDTGRVKNGKK